MSDRVLNVLARKGTRVESVDPQMTVLDAVQRMNELHIGALLVTVAAHPIGILSERDVLTRVIAGQLRAETTRVVDVMTHSVITVDANATIAEAMILMTDNRCRHLPVLDGDQVCGMVSIGDLTSWLVRDHERTIHDLHDYICHT